MNDSSFAKEESISYAEDIIYISGRGHTCCRKWNSCKDIHCVWLQMKMRENPKNQLIQIHFVWIDNKRSQRVNKHFDKENGSLKRIEPSKEYIYVMLREECWQGR